MLRSLDLLPYLASVRSSIGNVSYVIISSNALDALSSSVFATSYGSLFQVPSTPLLERFARILKLEWARHNSVPPFRVLSSQLASKCLKALELRDL